MGITSHPRFPATTLPQPGSGRSPTNKAHHRTPSVFVIELLSGNLAVGIAMWALDRKAPYVIKANIVFGIMAKRTGGIPNDVGQGDIQERKVSPFRSANHLELGGKNSVRASN